ncbi:MAG: NRDE family protein [Clostridiales bacterium]|jgi:uncharacterized protein with NRDE domain|nr:NRDE family protein [Clostridiales bacterium]
MCLILFAYNYHPGYSLALAANRDEYYERPTAQATFWDDCPDVLAGRDLAAGGTWLGITRTGRFAALTNYRDPALTVKNPRSRGHLVSDYLCGNLSPGDYMAMLSKNNSEFNGFNLLAGDSQSLWHYCNIKGTPQRLPPGLYGLSNRFLDTPWPKVARGKENMVPCLRSETIDDKELLKLLTDDIPACDSQLPCTGVGLEWERILSPIFITSATYGTRSSTVLTIDLAGTARFTERTYFANLRRHQEVVHEFPFHTSH